MPKNAFLHEHYEGEGEGYARATRAYRAALKQGKRRSREGHCEAYRTALREMDSAHGPNSDEALAAAFHLGRFCAEAMDPVDLRPLLTVAARERERFGKLNQSFAGTLGWMAGPSGGPMRQFGQRALRRWSTAILRSAETWGTDRALDQLAKWVDEGDTDIDAMAEARAFGDEALAACQRGHDGLAEVAGEVAADLDDDDEGELMWVALYASLGRLDQAALLGRGLATAAERAGDHATSKALSKFSAGLEARHKKAKPPKAKKHVLPQAMALVDEERYGDALSVLEQRAAEPDFIDAQCARLETGLLLAVGRHGDAARVSTRLAKPLANKVAARIRLLEQDPQGALELVGQAPVRFSDEPDAELWELRQAAFAQARRFDELDGFLAELGEACGAPAVEPRSIPHIVAGKLSAQAERARLEAAYGVVFPDDLHALWEVAKSLSPDDPREAFSDLELYLRGPFDVLAGELDRARPRRSMWLHFRFTYHPPEYLTLLTTGEYGLNYGYWRDDWATAETWAVWSEDFQPVGLSAADLVRFELERTVAGFWDEYVTADSGRAGLDKAGAELMATAERLRRALIEAGSIFPQTTTGSAYLALVSSHLPARRAMVAQGQRARGDRMGVRRTGGEGPAVVALDVDPSALGEIAKLGREQAARGNFLTALEAGRSVWREGGEKHHPAAHRLLDDAYGGLKREGTRRILSLHAQDRFSPSVDVFDDS